MGEKLRNLTDKQKMIIVGVILIIVLIIFYFIYSFIYNNPNQDIIETNESDEENILINEIGNKTYYGTTSKEVIVIDIQGEVNNPRSI